MSKVDQKLFTASSIGNLPEVQSLLSTSSADINSKHRHGWTALLAASRYNHPQVVSLLLAQQDVDLTVTTMHGNTALHLACRHGSASIIPLLAANLGENEEILNFRNNFGNTALVEATQRLQLACVREMTKLTGVDWMVTSGRGDTLESIARSSRDERVLTAVMNRKRKVTGQVTVNESENMRRAIEVKHMKNEKDLEEEHKKRRDIFEEKLRNEVEYLKAKNKQEADCAGKRNSLQLVMELETSGTSGLPPPAPECPVCLESLAPPEKLYNCPDGHLICGHCRTRVNNCGLCRQPFQGRATAMEQYLREQFGGK